ncbi:hypothetical protein SRABI76_02840 [Microbacterium oxydans]|uniref:hypothetical protein n=1 Tax=Microbacterium oxydans TaxID=82380 RepID=UPI001D9D27FC|nr:hypothetical protein [Microbacterium oxydans]CAH0234378.1 hypothetical protein SRABI76_02840 [Microbacterium oxydans]
MSSPRPRLLPVHAVLLLAMLGVTACASDARPAPAAEPTTDAHDVGAGDAAEVAAPARALVIADADGALTLLDLATEERTALAEASGGVERIDSDGRLLFVAHDSAVDVIDTARWTVPHGDHTHSFLGDAGPLGSIDGDGGSVRGGEQSATVQFEGEVVVLPHDDLSLEHAVRLDIAADGPVLAFAGHLLVPSGGAIEVHDGSGDPITGAAVPCADVSDADITRVGAVFACADGAVLFTREVGGVVAGEAIPAPPGAPASTDLAGRTGRPDLAGVAGEQGAWLLDVRQRTWTLLASEVPLRRAVALGDDESRTIAVDAEGRALILGRDGAVLARTEPLVAASIADPASLDRLQLIVDAQSAYLSDPAAGAVYELDHTDDLRLTRTFTDLDPWFVQQVG